MAGVDLAQLFDGVADPDSTALDDPAEHSSAAAHFLAQAWTQTLDLDAGGTNFAYFEAGLADLELLADSQAVDVEALRGDVFPDHSRAQVHDFEGFVVYQEHLAVAAGSTVPAAFDAFVLQNSGFGQFLHG